MTIQWIEQVNVEAPPNRWLAGSAGFGYTDGDDTTSLAMQDKFRSLYIRKDFTMRALPTERNIRIWEDWKTTMSPAGKEIQSTIDIGFIPGGRRTTGKVIMDGEGDKSHDLTKIDPKDVKISLKIRYDDGFIAYLNGTEIVRAGVKSGRGKSARGFEGHEARDEDEFELKLEHLDLLKRGTNVLAVEGHNDEIDSSDFSLHPRLVYSVSGGAERTLVGRGETWQFYLGDEPEKGWNTKMAEEKALASLPGLNSRYKLRYGTRGTPLNAVAKAEVFPFADTGHVIHRVLLRGLQPDKGYAFTIHENASPYPLKNQKWFFKTAPATAAKPVKFVTGGDMFDKRPELDAMNRQAGYEEPLFALLGGDLAYANGKDADRWYDWVDSWSDNAVTQEDYLVPMIAVNHECAENLDGIINDRAKLREWDARKTAKFYFSLFPLPEDTTNFVIDFADYMSIVCLDSYHTQKPEEQTEWLEKMLQPRAKVPNLFACYHRPGFGTQVKDDIKGIREEWAPLFERYGVDVTFENDHHVYKRTMPLRGGELHRDGVTYMGDGAWGVKVREIPWKQVHKLGYIVRAESKNHLIRVGIYSDRQQFDAIDAEGRPVDSYMRFREN
jgi:hypothetical protein